MNSMSRLRFVWIGLVICFLLDSICALGQQSILSSMGGTGKVDGLQSVTLKGNTHRFAVAANDRGAANPATRADRMMLVLRRSPERERALGRFLESVQNPASSEYRHFLTPEQFGLTYGISDADLAEAQSWLASQGFVVNRVNKGRTAIEFAGTIGQLQNAFHTPIHHFQIGGVEHLANVTDPQIPTSLSRFVAGVGSLNDFKPHSLAIRGPMGHWSASEHRVEPDLTLSSSAAPYLFVGPGDAATIYDAPNSLNTHLTSNQMQYDGTGISIGVVGDTVPDLAEVLNYRSFFGLQADDLTIIYDGDYSNFNQNADPTEALLDIEVSGGLAPGAHVNFYTAGDTAFEAGVILAIYRAIDDNDVSILSVSFGQCEADIGAAGNQQILNAWEQAAAQGIAVTVATGDSGSAACDDPNTETVASHGLAVNGLASTPYNIAVGGTDFDGLRAKFSTYVSSTNGSNNTSALSYIPENPWNNSTSKNGMLSANSAAISGNGATNIVAGGGGMSSMSTVGGGGTQVGYSKPAWQKGLAASNADAVRDLPDVSLLAGSGLYGAVWAVCAGNDCNGPSSTISGVGGTSAAAPAMAGILAIINQKLGTTMRLGQPNWILYRLAQSKPADFHAVTSGNNSVYCANGTAGCGSNDFLTGYNAAASYSLATGLGSVDISGLVNDWGSTSLTSTTTNLTLDKTTFVHGTSVQVGVQVSPAAASGDVGVVNNAKSQNSASGSSQSTRLALQGGVAQEAYTGFPGGTYNVYANYEGDGGYASSSSQPVQVTVTPEDSALLFTANTVSSNGQLGPVNLPLPFGTVVSLNAQPVSKTQAGSANPVTNATGSVSFLDSLNGNGGTPLGTIPIDASGNAEVNNQALPVGMHSITAQYSGDLSYNASQAGPVNFQILPISTGMSISSSDANTYTNVTVTAEVTANLAANQAIATGLVTFTDTTNNSVLGTGTPSAGSQCPGVTSFCVAMPITVYETQLASGANSITATYSGDSNFTGSTTSSPVVVNCTAGCSNGTGQFLQLSFYGTTNGILAPGGSSTTTVSVAETGGFTGAVSVTCSISGTKSTDIHIPTCSFNPAQVTLTSTEAVNTTLTINTIASTTSQLSQTTSNQSGRGVWLSLGGVTFASALLFGLPSRSRNWQRFAGLLLLFSAITLATSCSGGGGSGTTGGGGGGGSTAPGTTADTYTVTFHATDVQTGTVTAQDYFTFVVN